MLRRKDVIFASRQRCLGKASFMRYLFRSVDRVIRGPHRGPYDAQTLMPVNSILVNTNCLNPSVALTSAYLGEYKGKHLAET